MDYFVEYLFHQYHFASPEDAVQWVIDKLEEQKQRAAQVNDLKTAEFVDDWSRGNPVSKESLIHDLINKGSADVQLVWKSGDGKPVIGPRILIESAQACSERMAESRKSLEDYLKGTPFEPA